MKIHYLHRRQRLAIDPETAWAFFANPANLLSLSPPELALADDSPEANRVIRPGMIQVLRFHLQPPGLPRLAVPCRWMAEITHVEAPRRFIDVQRTGPFAVWHHRHEILPVADGVEVIDAVHYALPFGPLGEVLHALFVRRALEVMFDYRARMLDEFFGSG